MPCGCDIRYICRLVFEGNVSIAELENSADDFDRAVLDTPEIAPFCSSSDWILAAHYQMHPDRRVCIVRRGEHWLALAEGPVLGFTPVLQPMEAAWCFSCPFIGRDGRKSMALLVDRLGSPPIRDRPILLGGIPLGGTLHELIRRELGKNRHVQGFRGIECLVAALEGGLEGFLSRRSAHFRERARAALRRARRTGLEFCYGGAEVDSGATFTRLLDIEQRSWKWKAGESIFQLDEHRRFYADLIDRITSRRRLRRVFLRHGNRDIAYAVGGVIGTVFRGLQMGYDREFAQLGPGNIAQLELIRGLSEEGVLSYDLGMDVEYKERWADDRISLCNFLIL